MNKKFLETVKDLQISHFPSLILSSSLLLYSPPIYIGGGIGIKIWINLSKMAVNGRKLKAKFFFILKLN
jgi:hypothetical protein